MIDGEIVVTEPTVRHQRITGEIYGELRRWLRAYPGHGEATLPLDVHLDDHNAFAPDVLFVLEADRPGRDHTHRQPTGAGGRGPST